MEENLGYDWVHFGAAKVFFSKGCKKKAIAELLKVIEINPDYYMAHYHLGIAFGGEGKSDLAINSFEKVLAIKPSHAPTLFQLGRLCRIYEKNVEKARGCLVRSIELDPAELWAHFELGILYRDMGELDSALRSFRDVLRLDPKNIPATRQLGRVLRLKGDFESAIQKLKSALEFKPGDTDTMIELGLAYRDDQKIDEAIALYVRILERSPDNAIAHNHLGCLFRSAGNEQRAEIHLKKALVLNPMVGAFYFEYGLLKYRKKQYRTARKHFLKTLEFRPDIKKVYDYLDKINACC